MVYLKVVAYLRLSREDGYDESVSIANQRKIVTQYAQENGLFISDFYIDDGVSGTTFERPNFQRLIKDIESGKINCVITKDYSRLGRDYIGTGELIEKYLNL